MASHFLFGENLDAIQFNSLSEKPGNDQSLFQYMKSRDYKLGT